MNEIIQTLLETLGYPAKYLTYTGNADKYFIFNYADDRGEAYADDAPTENVYSIQIHFFSPLTFDHTALKKQIRDKLFQAGFTYPTIQTIYEREVEKTHLVFECEYAESQEV